MWALTEGLIDNISPGGAFELNAGPTHVQVSMESRGYE